MRKDVEPPASRYPTVAGRSLVPRSALNAAGLRGINVPENAQLAFRLDNGEKESGIATIAPPKVGKPYVVLLPQLDDDGNEIVASTPEEFATFLRTETVKWAKVARAAGIKPE